ncbi:META domain-containing protein [Subtercola sp. Z020]|uniref:META domain-containing protein n=1 Tax=Subtercola sp. Z020 TaxID=2080582 RepID=UPI000CE7304A|nr:META domain-containing protein [Subtercola sp. Z020]PPF81293.1 META domain-containing protein [Subtercola sp. Z020]
MTRHFSHSVVGAAGLALAGLALASVLGGCASSAGTSTGPADPGASSSAASIVGTWGETAPQKPHLTFEQGSSVSGNDGCNSLSSSYVVSGDTVTFSETTSTLMACIGVDSWLSALSTATVDGDSLIVKNTAGDTIGTLTRAA